MNKVLLISFGLVIGTILMTNIAFGAYWFNSTYRQRIPLNISIYPTCNSCQIKIMLNYSVNMSSDFSNIIISNASHNSEIPYWIENYSASSYAIVWLLGNWSQSNGTQAYIYYANNTPVTSRSSASSVFIRDIDNLNMYLHMDENTGTAINDSSYKNNNGTTGGTVWTTGVYGSALYFVSTSSPSIVILDSTSLDFSNNMSVEFWIKPNSSQDSYADIMSKHGGTGAYAIEQNSGSTNQFAFIWSSDGSSYNCGSTTLTLTANSWQHVAFVKNGTMVIFYLNGSYSGNCVGSGSSIYNSANSVYISRLATTPVRYINGILDEFKMYNYSMTSGEVNDSFNNYGYATNNYTGHMLLKKYLTNEPTYTNGSAEYYASAPLITIVSPANSTYYGKTSLTLNFTVTSDNTVNIPCWYSKDGGSETSTGNVTNNTYYSTTLTSLTADSRNVTVKCQDNTPQNGTSTQYYYNWHGLYNVSAYYPNGTSVSSWNFYATNGTTTYYNSSLTNPTSLEWNILPRGNINVTLNSSLFTNYTINNTNINNTMRLVNMSGTLYKYQQFAANVEFTVNFTNGTTNYSYSSSSYKVIKTIAELPLGSVVNATFYANNFIAQTKSYNINTSSEINDTITLIFSGITFNVLDEDTREYIPHYKVIMTNGSNSNYITVDKTSSLAFLDDSITTSLNNSIVNYTFAFGYTNGNFSVTYATNGTLGTINISIFDPLTQNFINVFSRNSTNTSKITEYFTVNNTNNAYGDYSAFNLNISGGNTGIYEINLEYPYAYDKYGRAVINFTNFNIMTGEARFMTSSVLTIGSISIVYPTRVYFIEPTPTTVTNLTAYLSYNCFNKIFRVYQSGNIVSPLNVIGGASITIQRVFDNVASTIAQEKTNDLGTASICVEEKFPYNFYVSKTNYTTFSSTQFTFFNDGTTTDILLSNISSGVNITNELSNVIFNVGTGSYDLFKPTTKILNLSCSVYDSQNRLNWVKMNITNRLNGSIVYNLTVITPSGTTIYYNITTNGTYDLMCGYSINLNSGTILINVTRTIVYYQPSGLTEAGKGLVGNVEPTTMYMIGLLISMLLCGFLARYLGLASGFIFILVFGFIFTILGDWGFNIQSGIFIVGVLIYLGLLMVRF